MLIFELFCCLGMILTLKPFYVFYSDKFTRFCQWKNVELNIHVSFFFSHVLVPCALLTQKLFMHLLKTFEILFYLIVFLLHVVDNE